MQLHHLLALSAQIGAVIAGNAVANSSVTNEASSAAFRPICGVRGYRPWPWPIITSNKLAHNTFAGCSKLCELEPECQSFSFQIDTGGLCSLYDELLTPFFDLFSSKKSKTLFFDFSCPVPIIPGPKLVPYEGPTPVSLPPGPGPTVTFAPFVPPVIEPVDSPPFVPEGPQSKPADDDDFISTYTYTEYPLTLSREGTPPLTTGVPLPSGTELPTLPCLVTPGSQSPFFVVNENFIPMVSRTNSIGPLLQPTAPPAPDDPILDPLKFKAPSFFLKEVSGNTGVFDLVHGESGQFVAMTNNGRVILTDSSTGPTMSNGRVTSIFNFDCRGAIAIKFGGSDYIWSTNGASSSIEKGKSLTFNMKAVPVTPPEIQAMLMDKRAVEELTAKLYARANRQGHEMSLKTRARLVNADSRAPQCRADPPGLVSKTKAGFKQNTGNFCDDLDDWWGISPFSFDGSCAAQSLCYDQCEGFSFTGCNAIFGTAMQLSCLSEFDSWWEVIQAVACAAQAAYFTGLAATDTGRRLYYKAQENMCFCFCSNPPDTCLFQSGAFYCANTKGTDDNNCGGCGTQCGANSKCRSGKCGCPRDQCSTTCLDLRNNPGNCGKCGVACNPKYCIDGSCYVPKPEECAPDQSVFNNKFEVWNPQFVNWTFAAYPPSSMPSDIQFSAANYLFPGGSITSLSIGMTNLPSSGRQAVVTQKKVKLCPGFKYELIFNLGYVNQVGGSSIVSDADCDVRWLTGPPSGPFTNDNFQSSDKFTIGTSNKAYRTFGPWSLAVKEGDPGVTKIKRSLYIDLSAVISCRSGSNARFVITDIQMNPVGFTKREEHGRLGLEMRSDDAPEGDGDVQATSGDAPDLKPLAPVFEEVGLEEEAILQERNNWLVTSRAGGDEEVSDVKGPELKPVSPVLEELGLQEESVVMGRGTWLSEV
ncbi:hypothetical protein B0T14DRAFT_585915 [Immersiella caudata]|uniref:Apple domain-containing protein n=1 Tax=Immersiella caudata TaxID=314043 RepID=A0AA39WQZ2_9PEZI|nr:hypothetical protein B0T14DRAFT_585915 [Immersiella caudata]